MTDRGIQGLRDKKTHRIYTNQNFLHQLSYMTLLNIKYSSSSSKYKFYQKKKFHFEFVWEYSYFF